MAPEGGVAADIWSGGLPDEQELKFVLEVLREGMTFFDVGANVGLFTLPTAKKVGNGKIFSFEPCARTHERLLNNVKLNDLRNVSVMRAALGDVEGQAVLHVNRKGKDGLNTLGTPTHEYADVVGEEIVQTTKLDAFVRHFEISRVDVMKVDVEGGELLVFRGGAGLLGRADAPLILYESGFLSKGFGYHPVESMWLLQKHGYTMFVIDSRTGTITKPANSRAYNAMVIAVKPTHPAFSMIEERAR
jgi:FkbM family methyltransferase